MTSILPKSLMRKKAMEESRMSAVSEVTVQSRHSIIDLFPLHSVKGQAPVRIWGYLKFHLSSRWFTHFGETTFSFL